MLILPMQRKLDWREPPFLTIALLLVNVFVFLFFQVGDSSKYESVSEAYKNSGLLYLEAPYYGQFLSRQLSEGKNIEPSWIQTVESGAEKQDFSAFQHSMMMDFDFVSYLDESKNTIWDKSDASDWEQTRVDFYHTELKKISTFQYGFVPNEMDPSRLFTSQFMHGGVIHLLGNMLILFILGFGLERMLTRAKLLLVYLLTGAVGALAYGLSNFDSNIPLVGASGAISGMMGLYVGILGIQKIRFFYFIFAAFGYFRAPALILLPIWVLNELLQLWSHADSGVAYLAHIGGLVSGGILGWAFKSTWLRPKEDELAQEDESEALFRKQYAQALSDIEELRFKSARNRLFALWKKRPEQLFLLEHLFHLYKMQPQSKQLHIVMSQWIKHETAPFSDGFWKCLEVYVVQAQGAKMLSTSSRLKIIEAAMNDEQFSVLEQLLPLIDERKHHELMLRAVKQLKQHFKTTTHILKADEYDAWLTRLTS